MPMIQGQNGVYLCTLSVSEVRGGFRASITRVLKMNVNTGHGTEISTPDVPEHVAQSKAKAEMIARAYFKAWELALDEG